MTKGENMKYIEEETKNNKDSALKTLRMSNGTYMTRLETEKIQRERALRSEERSRKGLAQLEYTRVIERLQREEYENRDTFSERLGNWISSLLERFGLVSISAIIFILYVLFSSQ